MGCVRDVPVPVEVELETETGEIMDVRIVDEKLAGWSVPGGGKVARLGDGSTFDT